MKTVLYVTFKIENVRGCIGEELLAQLARSAEVFNGLGPSKVRIYVDDDDTNAPGGRS